MAENLEQNFVALRHGELGSDGAAELRLDHGEGRFDGGALVVVRQKLGALVLEEAEQARPNLRAARSADRVGPRARRTRTGRASRIVLGNQDSEVSVVPNSRVLLVVRRRFWSHPVLPRVLRVASTAT